MTTTLPELLAEEYTPATQAELARYVAENHGGPQRVVYPTGGRTALHYGCPATETGVAISSANLTGVIDYPARDLTITVEAGMRIEALQELLKTERQRLPIDVPEPHRATVGGILACNTSGARRYGCGTLRDYLIGISAVDAQGTLFKAGGRVVKNVAGYDLCKVLIGSLGTLGIITQVTFKLNPIPESSRWLWAAFPTFGAMEPALQRLMTSATRPVALETLDPLASAEIAAEARTKLPVGRPVLGIAYEGLERETAWQIETLQQELQPFRPTEVVLPPADDCAALWSALTEFCVPTEEPLTFQAQVLPSKTCEFLDLALRQGICTQGHVGNGIVLGHLPDNVTSASVAAQMLAPLRQFARGCGGNLVIWNCPEEWKAELPVFGEREPGWPLMQALKQQLDPYNLLNRGRFVV